MQGYFFDTTRAGARMLGRDIAQTLQAVSMDRLMGMNSERFLEALATTAERTIVSAAVGLRMIWFWHYSRGSKIEVWS